MRGAIGPKPPRLAAAASNERISGIEPADPNRSRDAPEAEPPIMRELGLHAGAWIADSYRIERALGAGGMGVVTLARDERLERLVAIKFVRPELFDRPSLRELFHVEARAMARVSHPNVLTIHSFGEHASVPYFVMEYVDGPTVEGWLEGHRAAGRLPDVAAAVQVLEQVCLGVEAIHAADTVHRDLKPSNLLMSGSPGQGRTIRVAVSDLGVARILSDESGEACVVGSAAYMAPEAALGDDSRPELATRRDVYALGCIAYELLTGSGPFEAPNEIGLMSKHLLEPPPRPSDRRPELSRGYDDVLLRAIDKDPSLRWGSVADLRRALVSVRDREHDPASILVADDDEDWRELLRAALASRFPDARIDLARDGEEALSAFDAHAHDVVVVDLAMPELDGNQVTAELRSRRASRSTAIVVVTSVGGSGDWRRLRALGADGFLVKPVVAEDVEMLIRRALRSRVAA